tara:strand:- start:876 stop:1235 length:360 start_codon:yes stop_codon:yes gene_type:complete
MKYTISVKASPKDSAATKTVIDLIYELLERKHLIERVFFQHDGALQALSSRESTAGQDQLLSLWKSLADRNIELAVCITSAAKRGVSQKSDSLADGFELVGLGQLISAIEASDRYIEVF